jgi:hypothetical protein
MLKVNPFQSMESEIINSKEGGKELETGVKSLPGYKSKGPACAGPSVLTNPLNSCTKLLITATWQNKFLVLCITSEAFFQKIFALKNSVNNSRI